MAIGDQAFVCLLRSEQQIFLDETVLDWLGVQGNVYSMQRRYIAKLLKRNPDIAFQVFFVHPEKSYFVMRGQDLKKLILHQMKTPTIHRIQNLLELPPEKY